MTGISIKRRGRPAGRRGFTDQEIIDYVHNGHTIREAAERFGLTFQRISQITIKHGKSLPRSRRVKREEAA